MNDVAPETDLMAAMAVDPPAARPERAIAKIDPDRVKIDIRNLDFFYDRPRISCGICIGRRLHHHAGRKKRRQ